MKRLALAGLAALALAFTAPTVADAQVRVSVNLGGSRYGYGHRVYAYTPRVYYGGYRHSYRSSYGYRYPRYEVVRVYRPAPVVVYGNYHRVYRTHRSGYRGYRHR